MNPAILVDIDGTVADLTHRLHHIKPSHVSFVQADASTKYRKNWKKFHEECVNDSPIDEIIHIIQCLHNTKFRGMNVHTLFVTARHEANRHLTECWLNKHLVPRHELYMRADDDYRSDDIVKEEILDTIIQDGYTPILAFEDRKRVADMYRRRGIRVMHVADGDF